MLNVTQSAISKHFKIMGKIYKEERWIPWIEKKRYRKAKNHFQNVACQVRKKEVLWLAVKSGFISITSNAEKPFATQANHRQRYQKRNIYGKMAVLCIWWDQKRVYYEILKLGQIVTGDLYQQQMIRLSRALREKRPGYEIRQHKVILLHNNLTSRH